MLFLQGGLLIIVRIFFAFGGIEAQIGISGTGFGLGEDVEASCCCLAPRKQTTRRERKLTAKQERAV
jgi:hypothetical protein